MPRSTPLLLVLLALGGSMQAQTTVLLDGIDVHVEQVLLTCSEYEHLGGVQIGPGVSGEQEGSTHTAPTQAERPSALPGQTTPRQSRVSTTVASVGPSTTTSRSRATTVAPSTPRRETRTVYRAGSRSISSATRTPST